MQQKEMGLHILVCDTDAENRHGLSEMLEQMGHLVRQCNNGQEALGCLRGREFDLGILGARLPDLGGVAIAEKYHYSSAGNTIPLILLSENTREELNEVPRDYFVGHLDKPVDYQKLAILIARASTKKMLSADQVKIELEHVSQLAVFDPAEFSNYPKEALEEEFLASLFNMFLENARGKLKEISASIAQGDYAAFSGLIHAMKGIAGNVKAKRMEAITNICQRIDRKDFADSEIMDSIQEILQTCLQATAAAMSDFVKQRFMKGA